MPVFSGNLLPESFCWELDDRISLEIEKLNFDNVSGRAVTSLRWSDGWFRNGCRVGQFESDWQSSIQGLYSQPLWVGMTALPFHPTGR